MNAQPIPEGSIEPARGWMPINYRIPPEGYAALARDPATDVSREPVHAREEHGRFVENAPELLATERG